MTNATQITKADQAVAVHTYLRNLRDQATSALDLAQSEMPYLDASRGHIRKASNLLYLMVDEVAAGEAMGLPDMDAARGMAEEMEERIIEVNWMIEDRGRLFL